MPSADRAGLRAIFVAIVLTEVVTVLALYWFGAHFS
jgi:hypothetical protein